ncbi:hypothetical protein [Gorillibacterium timonense]|uniref:hypothetical protein n=1 Tax=Gorillibacterium timonense TaxID=1689269 RepID=UPI00071C9BB4|nr:hypothetical protein [Gorillibacterium timonense]
MKRKMILFLSVMLTVSACTGCRYQTPTKDISQNDPVKTSNEETNGNGQNVGSTLNKNNSGNKTDREPENGDELLANSTRIGTVIEFSDHGSTIAPTVYEGDIAYEAAPGYEDKQNQVTVAYDEDCTFLIAYVNVQTKAVTYDAASESDIKKQTHLVIRGEYDSNKVLHASDIFIYRNKR